MKQFHYEFDAKRSFQTSYNQAFTGQAAAYEPVSADAKNDLRKGHFNMGTDNPDYKSIAQLDYDNKIDQFDRPAPIDKNAIRKHNFTLGSEPVNYETTSKSNYVPNQSLIDPKYSIYIGLSKTYPNSPRI